MANKTSKMPHLATPALCRSQQNRVMRPDSPKHKQHTLAALAVRQSQQSWVTRFDWSKKINKGNSCVSVSQKLKQTHAVKCGSPQQKPKPFKKCIKLHKTEVSHTNIPPIRPYILRHKNIKSPGHGFPRDPIQPRLSRLLNPSKATICRKIAMKKGKDSRTSTNASERSPKALNHGRGNGEP